MSLVFVGGARGVGKTPIMAVIAGNSPEVKHIILSKEVKKLHGKNGNVPMGRMRDLSLMEQGKLACEAVRAAKENNGSRLTVIEGHFTCSHNSDKLNFYPFLENVSGLFDIFVLLERPIYEINSYRVKIGKKPRKDIVISTEIMAEKNEAFRLSRLAGKPIIVIHTDDFPRIVQGLLSLPPTA